MTPQSPNNSDPKRNSGVRLGFELRHPLIQQIVSDLLLARIGAAGGHRDRSPGHIQLAYAAIPRDSFHHTAAAIASGKIAVRVSPARKPR